MNQLTKKISYVMVLIIVSLTTLYLVITTVQLNTMSSTRGPVHWHADFEILACGKEIELAEPKGMSNKQGTNSLHAHNDNRIHVEGVLLDKKEASLGAFFHSIGGSLSSDGMMVPAENGLVLFHNGDKCNEIPAKLYVFVNGKLVENPSNYIISPYEKVPPGDRIKFVFTEKAFWEINPNIGMPHLDGRKTGIPPQTRSYTIICDLDLDEDCDSNDLTIFDSLIGKCGHKLSYKADFDDDGCITSTDREFYLQLYHQAQNATNK